MAVGSVKDCGYLNILFGLDGPFLALQRERLDQGGLRLVQLVPLLGGRAVEGHVKVGDVQRLEHPGYVACLIRCFLF